MLDTVINLLFSVLFFAVPLVMTSATSELFEFNKMLFIYLLTIFILFTWLIKMLHFKTIILKKTIFDIPLFIFFIIITISTFFSIDIHTSIFGYYGRFNGGWLSIFSYLVLYYAFVSNFNSWEKIEKLLKTSVISSLMVILWGLPGKVGYDLTCLLFAGQWNNACWTDQFHPESRLFSTLGQPNWLGAYLAINLFLALYFLLKSYYYKAKNIKSIQKGYIKSNTEVKKDINLTTIFWLLYMVVNFTCILFTRSRSAIISVLIGIVGILFILTTIFLRKKTLKSNSLLFCTILIIFMIPAIIFKTGISRIDNLFNFEQFLLKKTGSVSNIAPVAQVDKTILISESFDIRKIVWAGAVELGKKYPILGTGPETFAYSYYFVRPAAHNYVSEWDYLYNKAHNEFLNYLATTGFIGLFVYCLLILVFIFYVFKSVFVFLLSKLDLFDVSDHNFSRFYANVCLGSAYLSILITNFFGFATTTINLFFFIIPGIIFLLNHEKMETKKQFDHSKLTNSNYQIGGYVLLSLILVILVLSLMRYWMADTLYAKADIYLKSNDYQTASNMLYDALKLKYEHVYEDKLAYSLANLALLASYQKKGEIIDKLINEATRYNNSSIAASPKNILYWKTKAKIYYLFYQLSLKNKDLLQGIKALEEGSKYAPTDPKIPYSLAVFYSLIYDESKDLKDKNINMVYSLKYIDQCLKLKTDYRDGYFLKGQLQKKYNQKTDAKKTFEYIINSINKNDADTIKELKDLN